ncbi:L-threonylcarbamoyladenylate synthase [Candidatus Fukatsuia symbiotica]|uniref:Threonylcarbamoyl-AMP synthase n=1 Tax=Candidatus Fukatsuia symbiotica TaxID=1878942 RepID=A0A2U8I550_9GAMM|nr:L-threonylcarbamoyladenylate synthase [Candidatus Fukatsuia symbiotica]AWK14296.1 threonylcarbamoyl-AMP synthase [Candidatus Fukatsuia symbiotica]MEA9444549.1 L-threonylcarbamoyladenylate synthase [Candidatus Fukatsuia symbiotica]
MSQYFRIHVENPQLRLIKLCVDVLQKGGVIVYPTDSGYALGCRLEEKNAMGRICRIRQLDSSHNFTLVCRDLSVLATYAQVDNRAFRLIKNNIPGNYTFILVATKEVPRRLMNDKRKTIGLRVLSNPIALALMDKLQEPLMSTTLMLPGNDFAESDPEKIKETLSKQVDLIIDGGVLGQQPTTVIDMTESIPTVIREGSGDLSPFS